MTLDYIAFYGTLMSYNQTAIHKSINQKLVFVSNCTIPGKLYNKGRYPALIRGAGKVHGELYSIKDTAVLGFLDNYEASDENHKLLGFKRYAVKLLSPSVNAYVYYYEGPVSESQFIESGSWN